ncbi:protein ALP1-like [Anneissia japonica]|uniref:protein ALP1-like n=1 Tax=Anneissia japonica TaxID=1529436 RepID=UPI0014259451|nr:protein ALP1-like [Anneissia japonica]
MLQIFELKYGFPMCGGAIDGCHIPIIAPRLYHTDYYNRKGWYSILLQGLVDHNYKFIDFDVGQPGKCHDAYVFEMSKLYRKLSSGTFYPPFTKTIEGKEVPIVILGDSAYALSTFLMKPYAEGLATAAQKRFNERLSRTRILVEHSFGRLKGRWRSIMKRNDSQADKIHIVVASCIVLHNFCEVWNMDYEEYNNFDVEQPGNEYHPDEEIGNENEIRTTLVQYFTNNPY